MTRRWGAALGSAAVVLALVAAPSRASAQSPPAAPETLAVGDWLFAPSLELRARGEYLRDPVDIGGGLDVNGQNPGPRIRNAGGVMERSRLGLGVELATSRALRAQLTLQDSRVWGAPSAATGLAGSGVFAPYEAFVEARTSAARASWLRVGRQAVVWGDGRLLGNADWSATPRSLDAARAHLALGSAWDFELLASVLATSRPLGASFGGVGGDGGAIANGSFGGVQLYGAQIGWTLDPLFAVQAFAFARIARSGAGAANLGRSFALSTKEGETYTGALRIGGDSKGWRYAVEGAYQIGNVANFGSGGVDRTAYAAAAYVQKTLDRVALTPTFRVGGAYASGDDGSGDYKQFDPLLPDVHAFHGAMDVFAWSNVVEGNVRATIVPVTDTAFAVEYRYAQMAEAKGEWLSGYLASIGRGAGASAELGHEFDAFFTYAPWTALVLHAGYSAFFIGDGARAVLASQGRGAQQADGSYAPASISHYGYLQATLRVP